MEAVLWDGGSGAVLARKWNVTQTDLSEDGKLWAVATRPFENGFPAPPNAPVPAAPVEKKTTTQARPALIPSDNDAYFVVQKVEPVPQPKPTTEPPKVIPKAPIKDGPPPVVVAPPQTTVTLFDGDGKELAKLHSDFTSEYGTLAFDPTGKRLIGVADGASVRIWDVATRKLTAQYLTDDPEVAISPDGRFLAYLSERPSMTAPPGAPPAPKAMPKATRNDVTPPAEYVVLQPGPTPIPQPPAPVPGTTPAMMVAPAMPMPANQPRPGDRQTTWVMVVDLATGKLIWQANVMGTDIGGMAFSSDGKRLALGFADEEAKNDRRGYVQVWDTAAPEGGQTLKFQAVARYSGHIGAVHAVAFSPDGQLLASGGDDRIVKVWKLPAEGEQGPGGDIGMGFPVVASPGAPIMVPPAPMPIPAPVPSPGK